MVPLTDIIRNLVERDYGLKVADAGAAFGTADDIVALCMAARFKDVQVAPCLCTSDTTAGSAEKVWTLRIALGDLLTCRVPLPKLFTAVKHFLR